MLTAQIVIFWLYYLLFIKHDGAENIRIIQRKVQAFCASVLQNDKWYSFYVHKKYSDNIYYIFKGGKNSL